MEASFGALSGHYGAGRTERKFDCSDGCHYEIEGQNTIQDGWHYVS
jgi:hypothetical protein